jgi:hypothetical protein
MLFGNFTPPQCLADRGTEPDLSELRTTYDRPWHERAPLPDDGPHIFECSNCKVVFMTEDHVPVSGVPV